MKLKSYKICITAPVLTVNGEQPQKTGVQRDDVSSYVCPFLARLASPENRRRQFRPELGAFITDDFRLGSVCPRLLVALGQH